MIRFQSREFYRGIFLSEILEEAGVKGVEK